MEPKSTQAQGGQDAGETASEPLTEDRVIAIVNNALNPAITGHLKRFGSQMEKTIADVVGKSLATLAPKPADPPPASDSPSGTKPDPESAKLREKLDKLERSYAESEARAKATEEKARKEAMRTSVKEALEAKGIKGARARAVIADLEQSGALRFNEEGEARMVVKRSRGKNAPVEELEWDVAQGVDDWSKTADAAEFLPAPTPPPPRGGYGARAPETGPRRGAPRWDKPAVTEAEALARTEQSLLAQGVDIASAFRR